MRKILFFSTALLILSSIVNAQDKEKLDLPCINQNNWYVGGKTKLNFTSQNYLNDEKIKTSMFRFSPTIGYFVADRWGVDFSPSFESQSTEYPNLPKEKYNEFSLGLGSRYYLMPNKQNTNFFVHAGFEFGSYKSDNYDERFGFNSYNAGASFVYFKNRHVGLEIGLDYRSKKYEEEDDRISSIGLCAGLQIHLDPCGGGQKKRVIDTPRF